MSARRSCPESSSDCANIRRACWRRMSLIAANGSGAPRWASICSKVFVSRRRKRTRGATSASNISSPSAFSSSCAIRTRAIRRSRSCSRATSGLSYKLLRMVNSASTGGRDIWSIGHALRLLGREQVGRWLSVLLVTDGESDGVRGELMHLALLRARMCERVADITGLKQARGSLFLIGMLSVLDQLLELPMASLCDAMDLAPDLRGRAHAAGGLLRRRTPLGRSLRRRRLGGGRCRRGSIERETGRSATRVSRGARLGVVAPARRAGVIPPGRH